LALTVLLWLTMTCWSMSSSAALHGHMTTRASSTTGATWQHVDAGQVGVTHALHVAAVIPVVAAAPDNHKGFFYSRCVTAASVCVLAATRANLNAVGTKTTPAATEVHSKLASKHHQPDAGRVCFCFNRLLRTLPSVPDAAVCVSSECCNCQLV
jgi:hypothetical protein